MTRRQVWHRHQATQVLHHCCYIAAHVDCHAPGCVHFHVVFPVASREWREHRYVMTGARQRPEHDTHEIPMASGTDCLPNRQYPGVLYCFFFFIVIIINYYSHENKRIKHNKSLNSATSIWTPFQSDMIEVKSRRIHGEIMYTYFCVVIAPLLNIFYRVVQKRK